MSWMRCGWPFPPEGNFFYESCNVVWRTARQGMTRSFPHTTKHTTSHTMKTKLTLLLALALCAPAFAEKPNFNGVKPATRAPAVRSAPSMPAAGSSRSVNVGQIKGITRSVPPLVTNAAPYQPRQAPTPPPRAIPSKKVPIPASSMHKPAARNSMVTKPGSLTRNPPAGIRSNVPNAVGGINSSLASALAQGRELASGLQSIESLRGSISSLREFGDVFHQPGNSGPSGGANIFSPFGSDPGPDGNTEVHNPLDRSANRGPRDIRGDMANTRPGNGSTGLSSTGDSVLESEISSASGSGGSSTPVQSTTEENGDVTASSTATTAGGATTSVEVTEHAKGSGTTATTHGNDGRVDNLTVTRRDSSGAVVWSRSETVYPGGKAHVVTRDGSGRVTSDTREYFLPRSSSCGINPPD